MKRHIMILILSILLGSLLTACNSKTILRYSVTGAAEEVSIRYVNELGETSAETIVTLPFELEFNTGNELNFQIYVTNISGQGEIQCEVFADDRRLGNARGYTFAGCEGNYEKQGNNIQTYFRGYDDVIPESYEAPAIKLPEGLSGMILFANDQKEAGRRDFYVYDLSKGGEPIQLTDGLSRSSSCPRLSPDGKQLSFVYRASIFDLFVVNMDGTGLTNLTNNGKDGLEGFCANWSPDGSQIVFDSAIEETPNDWFTQIYSANADGSGITQLTANNNEKDDHHNPVWSPDGQKIAFISDVFGQDVYVMNADGSDLTLFGDIEELVKDFHWSPDGAKIVFACHRGLDSIGEGVCIMNSDGSGFRKVEDESLEGIYYTAWSPDGMKIAFAARNENSTNIYVVNPDGTGLTQLTRFNGMTPYWISWYESIELPAAPIPVSIEK